MDEIEYRRAMKNLIVLVENVEDATTQNAFKVMAAMIDGLNERIIELQAEEDDD